MKHKKQIIYFFFPIVIILTSIETLYLTYPIPTNITETRKLQIDNLEDTNIKNIVFGSSVTHGVLGDNPYIIDNTFNASTVGASTLYGQYFLSKKAYENNQKIKHIYFSFVPHMLSFNVTDKKNKRVQRFFNNVFKEKEFVNILQNLDKSYVVTSEDYFLQRRLYLYKLFKKIAKETFSNHKLKLDTIAFTKHDCNNTSNDIKEQILRHSQLLAKQEMDNQYIDLIKKIENFNTTHSAKIIFILEPVPTTQYNEFVKTQNYKNFISLVKTHKIDFIDSNKITQFKDCYFQDHLHLNTKSTGIYFNILINIINKNNILNSNNII